LPETKIATDWRVACPVLCDSCSRNSPGISCPSRGRSSSASTWDARIRPSNLYNK
jgi:hypothetical protein